MSATLALMPLLKQPPETGSLLERVSASRLQTFHQCRLKFCFRYVLRLPTPKSPALRVGSAVHHALQQWNRARWFGRSMTLEQMREGFDLFWNQEQEQTPVAWPDGCDPEQEQTEAWSLVEAYLEHSPIPPDEKPEGVEVGLELDLCSHGLPALTGFIDLVRPGARIVDFKTTAQTPNPSRAAHLHELQLSCYGLLYREAAGRRESGFELHHLVKLKTPKVVVIDLEPMTRAQQTRLFRSIESYVDGVEREDWVPSPNPMTCACCEYFAQCRSWTGERDHGKAS